MVNELDPGDARGICAIRHEVRHKMFLCGSVCGFQDVRVAYSSPKDKAATIYFSCAPAKGHHLHGWVPFRQAGIKDLTELTAKSANRIAEHILLQVRLNGGPFDEWT